MRILAVTSLTPQDAVAHMPVSQPAAQTGFSGVSSSRDSAWPRIDLQKTSVTVMHFRMQEALIQIRLCHTRQFVSERGCDTLRRFLTWESPPCLMVLVNSLCSRDVLLTCEVQGLLWIILKILSDRLVQGYPMQRSSDFQRCGSWQFPGDLLKIRLQPPLRTLSF